MIRQAIGNVGKHVDGDAVRRANFPGGHTRRLVAGICCADRDAMAAARQAARERPGHARNPSVRPRIGKIGCDVEDSERRHLPGETLSASGRHFDHVVVIADRQICHTVQQLRGRDASNRAGRTR